MGLPIQLRTTLLVWGQLLQKHWLEIALAALFALPFGYLAGEWIERPDPFTIYVVADSDTNKETMDSFRDEVKGNFARLGDVDVVVKVKTLPENTEDAAIRMAQDLSSQPDTLMVIGTGRSQLVERSLPIYFAAKPRIPYLATTASDDDLLKNCDDKCYEWSALGSVWSKERFAPLLQLSPTNKIQASSAIEYAVENGRRRFLVIYGNDSQNKAYTDNLVSEYESAIQDAASENASEVNKFEVSAVPDDEKLKELNPDCVLYAGSFGEAQTVFNRFSHLHTNNVAMMIFSDAVIQTRGTDVQLANGFKSEADATLLPVRFTHQTIAADYNDHVATYDRDVFAIARTILEDLTSRGVDVRMRAKSYFHIHRVKDARRNLDRILKENSEVRTWYTGATKAGGERPNVYIFHGHNQYNGIFHVWKLQGPETNPTARMDDVDHWHPGRGIVSAQESAWLSKP
jgi:hypothetical protein